MRMYRVLLAAMSVAAASSTPSSAYEPAVAVLDTVFPFEGHTVPRNATLGAIKVDDTISGELTGDDGVARLVAWSDDDARFPAKQTTTVTLRANLESTGACTGPFDPSNPEATSNVNHRLQVFDALGRPIDVDVFFSKTADCMWEYSAMTDGGNLTGGTPGVLVQIVSGSLAFTSNGQFADAVTFINNFMPLGTALQSLTFDFGWPLLAGGDGSGTTQFAAANSISFVAQDGFAAGDGVLAAGRQVLTLLSTEDDTISRDIVFDVDDAFDTDAAAVSVSITRRTGSDSAHGGENASASAPLPTSFATIAIESGGDDAAFVQLQSGERLPLRNGALEISETDRNLKGLVVVDFAGNASTPEVVDAPCVVRVVGGASCQSNPASSAAWLALFAAVLGRRRR
jgi:uncharacterized protein (TIGR03382 family)